jgi:hypothetical protein
MEKYCFNFVFLTVIPSSIICAEELSLVTREQRGGAVTFEIELELKLSR